MLYKPTTRAIIHSIHGSKGNVLCIYFHVVSVQWTENQNTVRAKVYECRSTILCHSGRSQHCNFKNRSKLFLLRFFLHEIFFTKALSMLVHRSQTLSDNWLFSRGINSLIVPCTEIRSGQYTCVFYMSVSKSEGNS